MIRFIHTADIHLDSPLLGLSRYEGAPVELFRTASRAAFSSLVDAAISEAVDFVVIAGDLYDGDWRDYNTGLFFCREMGRLHDANIPVFVLYGNHDAKSEITKRLRLPKNVHEFSSTKPQTFELKHLNVALHGQSFQKAATLENLAITYPDALPGCLNIGVLHTALEGNTPHDPYAPCALPELIAKGYQYWALGHVHEHAIRHQSPWIVYPGNLQGRHIREPGARGAVLVSVDNEEISIERRHFDVLRWHHLNVDASAALNLEDAVERIGQELQQLVNQSTAIRTLAVRVSLKGRCKAHGQLFGCEQQLRAEVLAQANALAADALWIEKVCIDTTPALSQEELMARSDALADLQELLGKALDSPQFLQSIENELKELTGRCPKELFGAIPSLAAIRDGRVREVIKSVAPSLLAQLCTEP